MALLEQIEERRILREKVLSSLYESYFTNNGNAYRTTKDEFLDAKEEWLVYEYLQNKGLIQIERQGQQILLVTITSRGIDVFEESFLRTMQEIS